MKAAGNLGPSSSVLSPASCVLRDGSVTARGGYTDGGVAPDVYDRYGDVVELYVFTAPSPGYPHGMQVADLADEKPPPIEGRRPWTVTATVIADLGSARTCLVAAQPRHDLQLAP